MISIKTIDENYVFAEKNFKDDVEYLSREIIAFQNNGCICKYSSELRCVTTTNMSVKKYKSFWVEKHKPKVEHKKSQNKKSIDRCYERMHIIERLVDKKLEKAIPLERMIELVNASDDTLEDKQCILEAIQSDKKIIDIDYRKGVS